MSVKSEPRVRVGIMTVPRVRIRFSAGFGLGEGWHVFGTGEDRRFVPGDLERDWFEVADVVIGREFHWERRETQRFRGALHLLPTSEGVTIINEVGVEQYLESVISSEMSANASPEFLKAHAIISRSWVMAMLEHSEVEYGEECVETEGEVIKWYDRENHMLFDVCADDHCQRYQGITRQTRRTAAEAVRATRGQVLSYDGRICDARFSKCCGGAFEEFDSCWGAGVSHPYLTGGRDIEPKRALPDLRDGENARRWILGRPESFCNTKDEGVLCQVLNDYDLETQDFYRWRVDYGKEELRALILRKSGIDFGEIRKIEAEERGVSGRIVRLRIEGSKRSMVIGKELEIRRLLSESHLYSSAFVAELDADAGVWTLRGAGWGHGVGLCQIGAAMMAHEGYDHEEILKHYYNGAEIKEAY